MIRKNNGQYLVKSKSGKKLGMHDSKKKAQKQLAAVEINKKNPRGRKAKKTY